ncbi:hypothetical protein FZI85_20480 [Mycobacterium sp. CBMA293]|uniref:hypothetical protein n=1 Tax=unclassified Mycolicibacterium TaxID=2636767 RepID=UPI0012DF259D|nr:MULTISPECIES: hypothetical protein [unclassified Mycolicibacterium]MUL48835.1 hypothetical protein [Mycolicibacterium sp. CBMA 360]MUL62445.1 hypothetical protein [Mycolicibacterium sp. CBMA 335]MUL74136.1 hypothetical protein [Mycolicibacterium sp. CBMA 311]MUL96830.1 hypothetical protein [Mycolicibacterium sp. CBMA 230]MUM03877.1 hypothetical protein [Mycolicibacterium sp. CBMA 213]
MLPTTRESGLRAGPVPIPSLAATTRRTVRPGVVGGRPRVDTRPRPAHRADLAQSRLFEAMLLDEVADLEDQMTLLERRSRRDAGTAERGADRPSDALLALSRRLIEVQRMLDALHRRFPDTGDSLRVI